MTRVILTPGMWSRIRQEFPVRRYLDPSTINQQVDFRTPEITQWFERRWQARYNHFYTDPSFVLFKDARRATEFVLRYA